ncbi:MAG: hypothetical protein ABIQ39_03665, partial [Ilumatobacteraceae bacterium]
MFQIKSKTWNLIVVVGSIAVIAVGFGGLFGLQGARAGATATNLFVIAFGVLTFLFFAGPGIAFVARKRIPYLKKHLPGGSMAWVRAHLYLPVLAIVAAWVHASSAPFRSTLSSGKVLFGICIVVALAGVARHHLIGVSKAAVNADAQISRIASEHSRQFRQLVIDYKQLRRPLADIRADVASLSAEEQAAWAKVTETQQKIEHDFPRGGRQSPAVRALKLVRAVHAPLTVVLFLAMSFHVVDVLGTADTVLASNKQNIASASSCAGCHGSIADDWKSSSMAHAQTGTIMEAQLPVTLAKNEQLARELGSNQRQLFAKYGQTCINCHAPVGAQFVDDPSAVLPLNQATDRGPAAVSGGGAAINNDGVNCLVCHTQSSPLGEGAGLGKLNVQSGTRDDYGTVYGPLFRDPNPLPVRVHDIGQSEVGFWDDPIATSIACGACHNIKVDLGGDGTSPFASNDTGDDNGDFTLNGHELQRRADGTLADLVLQTTFDEWQDYVAGFAATIGKTDPVVDRPLGCIECHMPTASNDTQQPVVDSAPGFLPLPNRPQRSHTFVGVDYDLDPAAYTNLGLPADTVNKILADRAALLQSAVTLEVDDAAASTDGAAAGTQTADVVVTNNLLGHAFPTGFAFARQFWLEVSATDSNGDPVCLVNEFAGQGLGSPCSSGVVTKKGAPLPQCDPASVASTLGKKASDIPNGNIVFAQPSAAGDCDPWLANFQKILTDGDPTNSGTFTEVPYQSFLPDIVKVRQRTIDGLKMDALQSVRQGTDPKTGEHFPLDSIRIPYTFDTSKLPAGATIEVKATMHFRNLPPEFITGLAKAQRGLDNVTASARIDDPQALIDNLVTTDVVSAKSGDGPVLACKGPQNKNGATILDCVKPVSGAGAVDLSGGGAVPPGGQGFTDPWLTALIVGL